MDSESQISEVQNEHGNGTAANILAIVQIVFASASLILGGIIILGNIVYTMLGWTGLTIAPPILLSIWPLQSIIILVLSVFLLRANQGVIERIPDAFSSSFYIYVLLTVVYATMGSLGFIFIFVILLQFLILFLPSVRFFWFEEFVEDTKPRVKETRFTLHLVRKSPLVVIGILIITFMCGVALTAPWIATYDPSLMVFKDARLPPGSESKDIKQNYQYILEDRYFDSDIMPEYYYQELTITDVHLKTPEVPQLFIGVSDMNTGFDAGPVNVTFRIYALNLIEYETITVSERNAYLYWSTSVVDDNLLEYITLPNEEGVYIWELQFIECHFIE